MNSVDEVVAGGELLQDCGHAESILEKRDLINVLDCITGEMIARLIKCMSEVGCKRRRHTHRMQCWPSLRREPLAPGTSTLRHLQQSHELRFEFVLLTHQRTVHLPRYLLR